MCARGRLPLLYEGPRGRPFLGNYGRLSELWPEVRRCPALIYTTAVLIKQIVVLTGGAT